MNFSVVRCLALFFGFSVFCGAAPPARTVIPLGEP